MNAAAAERSGDSAARPVVACYCATFLKPEMLHIYRQITALQRVQPFVIARKREEENRFPFPGVEVVRKPATQFLRRIWYRQIRGVPWEISRGERERILHVLHDHGAELLHVYFGHIAVHLLPVIRSWNRPSIVSFHGADVMVELEKPAYRAATLRMLDAVRLVLVRSTSLRKALVSLGCPAEKIRIQRTGIPLHEFPFREREWPRDGTWRFLQAGRLIAKKGYRTSLRAIAKLTRANVQVQFTCAGEGPLLQDLQQLAGELRIAQQVNFTGFVSQEQLRELFYSSHVFLHPSETAADGNQEGVPNSLLEAMSTGLPVFATTHGGIPEAVEHGVSGILVPERDSDALAQYLLSATEQPQQLASIAKAGAAAVADKFEQRAQVRRLEDCYFDALHRSA